MIGFGQIVFLAQVNGSLIKNTQGEIVGSALVGQPFTGDRCLNNCKGARSPTPEIGNFD